MSGYVLRAAGVMAAIAIGAGGAVAAPAPSCFQANQWQGWRASESGDVLYFRVGLRDIYRVELTPGARVRDRGGDFLVRRVFGPSLICSPLDLNLSLRNTQGFERPVIVRSITKLSPEEIVAIPRKELP